MWFGNLNRDPPDCKAELLPWVISPTLAHFEDGHSQGRAAWVGSGLAEQRTAGILCCLPVQCYNPEPAAPCRPLGNKVSFSRLCRNSSPTEHPPAPYSPFNKSVFTSEGIVTQQGLILTSDRFIDFNKLFFQGHSKDLQPVVA